MSFSEKSSANWLPQLGVFIFFAILFGAWAIFLGQDVNWDLANYHFYDGYAFLHHRIDVDVAPAMMQTYLNPFFDVINYLFIIIQKPKFTAFLLSLFSSATAFLLYKIAMLLFTDFSQRKIYVFFSLLIAVIGVDSLSLLGTTTNDTKMCLMVIAALYCVLKALLSSEKSALHYIIFAALILGMAAGFKLPAACYALGMLVTVFFSNFKHSLRLSFIFCIFAIAGFLLANGYWMYVLYQHFQNPLYPYYNNIFHSSLAPFVSFNLPPSETKLYFYDYLLMPIYLAFDKTILTSERVLRDMHFFIIILFAVIFYFRKSSHTIANEKLKNAWQAATIFFSASYLIWISVFAVYRYAMPLEVISGIFIVYMAQSFFSSQREICIFLASLSCLLVATACYPQWGRKNFGAEYLSVTPPVLPSHAKVVLTTEPLAYLIPFFPADTSFIGMPFVSFGQSPKTPRKLYAKVIKQLSASAPLYVMSYQASNHADTRSMSFLEGSGFRRDESSCIVFKSNIDSLKICRLIKI
jgi:hypothetical protein